MKMKKNVSVISLLWCSANLRWGCINNDYSLVSIWMHVRYIVAFTYFSLRCMLRLLSLCKDAKIAILKSSHRPSHIQRVTTSPIRTASNSHVTYCVEYIRTHYTRYIQYCTSFVSQLSGLRGSHIARRKIQRQRAKADTSRRIFVTPAARSWERCFEKSSAVGSRQIRVDTPLILYLHCNLLIV